MMERVCVNCSKWHIEYEADWSEVTPGSGFSMWCEASHYSITGPQIGSEEHFRGLILTAQACQDFDPCTVKEKEQRGAGDPLITSSECFPTGGVVS